MTTRGRYLSHTFAVLAAVLLVGACGDDPGSEVTASRGGPTMTAAEGPEVAGEGPVVPSTPAEAPAAPAPVASPVPAAAPVTAPPAATVAAAPTAAPVVRLATLEGVVTRGGRPVIGARMSLVADDGAERQAVTGVDGTYRFADVAPGHYLIGVYAESGVTCDEAGCISASWAEREDVSLAPGEVRRLDIDGD